jgi:hypothetical protein
MDEEKYNSMFQEHGVSIFLHERNYFVTDQMCRFGNLMPDPDVMRRVLNAWYFTFRALLLCFMTQSLGARFDLTSDMCKVWVARFEILFYPI